MALLILLLGITSIKKTPTDIFPEIDIPVVTVVAIRRSFARSDGEADHDLQRIHHFVSGR
jgi:hypothetical protein